MKIISHVQEKKFLIDVTEAEFRQILGIEEYYISKEIDVDDCILNEKVLTISKGFKTAKSINSIVKRQSFKDMKEKLLAAVKIIEEAETKFCNLSKATEETI